jgi:hypothetical protein
VYLRRPAEGILQGRNIGHIARDEERADTVSGFQPVAKRRCVGALHEGDFCALCNEALGQIFADA